MKSWHEIASVPAVLQSVLLVSIKWSGLHVIRLPRVGAMLRSTTNERLVMMMPSVQLTPSLEATCSRMSRTISVKTTSSAGKVLVLAKQHSWLLGVTGALWM